MSLGASSSRHITRSSSRRYRPSWTERTFINSFDAETSLCADRPDFIKRHDIMDLIPDEIKKQLVHAGDTAQIKGFQGLFVYLNDKVRAKKLRPLVVFYFKDSPVLRGHLSEWQACAVRKARYFAKGD
jgi:hypothetical protein